ncbi:hypothetical protein Taro_033919 [Colocasia esculenta]|uniref:Uncharacterized protein n=1 Tax=Colocasia esculenta TaxID=4460 RepID=A0A843W8E1_COLES|nr:hypothetical protein [Colocasia esculenta]
MDKSELEPIAFTERRKTEPTLVPEWLKTNGSIGVSSSGGSNHVSGPSSHLDDQAGGTLSRNRLLVTASDRDSPRSSLFKDISSLSYRRSSSANGSLTHEKDISSHSRPYSSFGRSHRDRDRGKESDFRDKEKSINLENGIHDFPDSFVSNRAEKDTLRRSQSMIAGRGGNLWVKRTANDTFNSLSGVNIASGVGKSSFEREFPSLGTEDKQGPPEIGRVSSPGLSSAAQSLPLCSSAIIGGDGWTSALAEVPIIIGGNGPLLSSVQQTSLACATTVSSSTTGLNMAETLAQAPSRASTAPKLPVDTQRLEELAIKKSRQLIPVTPSVTKVSVFSSSEKLKSKGSRGGDMSTKFGQQPSTQSVSHAFRGSSRSDVSKPSLVGSFQVLNRDRDSPSPTNSTRALNPVGAVPSAATTPLKSPNNHKLNVKATSLPVTIFVEKRPVSQQNRSDFFNSLRKKTSANNSTATPDPSSYQSTILDKSEEHLMGASSSVCTPLKVTSPSDCGLDSTLECSGTANGTLDACGDFEGSPPFNGEKSSCLDPAEEERLLRLFGWKENAGEEEEALTAEEIDAFIKEYEKLRPSSKFCHRNLRLVKTMRPEARGGASGLS